MPKRIPFEEARRIYVHRYTKEHMPAWARESASNGKYYAPQYKSDREWYENTAFMSRVSDCKSFNPSWPLGMWLDKPFQITK